MDDGQIITSETLKGEVSLIVFFIRVVGLPERTSCAAKIYTDYGQRIRMVCISREESSAEIVRYWDENHLTLPIRPKKTARYTISLLNRGYLVFMS